MIDDERTGLAESAEVGGVLTKEFHVRLLDCSGSGCLLEANAPVAIGTVGALRVVWNGREVFEDVEVVRCHQIEGAGMTFHVGARFLWTTLPESRSLRRLARYPSA